MKKRTFKTLICAALAGISVLGFSACNLEAQTAYDVAVKNGFVGTEQEWLKSLQGSNGKDGESPTIEEIFASWKQQSGNEDKSFDEFLKEYLTVDYNEGNNTKQIAENLTSSVSIYCGICTATEYRFGGYRYEWGVSAGSGVIYSLNDGYGYVITNYHVLYSASARNGDKVATRYDNGEGLADNSNIFVYLYGSASSNILSQSQDGTGYIDASGTALKAEYVGGSMSYDVAVLKIYGDNLTAAQEAKTATAAKTATSGVTVGEKVYAIGNPSGNGISVSQGVVSVESEYITMTAADDKTTTTFHVLRTDTAINPGNSGGGLYNAQGALVGIVNAKTTTSSSGTSVENMGYALPIADVKAVADNIIDNGGAPKKPYFGITTTSEAAHSEWNEVGDKLILKETVKVYSVTAEGEQNSGIGATKFRAGDVICAVSIRRGSEEVLKVTVNTRADFTNSLLHVRAGDTLFVLIKRGNESITLSFEITQKNLSIA